MQALTRRQAEVLALIKRHIAEHGLPPTRAEIAKIMQFSSFNAAEEHLRALEKKGYIVLTPKVSRGISIVAAANDSSPAPTSTSRPSAHYLQLPLVGQVAAGQPIQAIEHQEDTLSVDASVFSASPDYLLRVRGDSMKDVGIMEGDLLAVQQRQQARDGQIVVARINDEVTVKRFFKKKQHIELHAENQAYDPIVVTPEDHFALEGLVVGLIRTQF